MQNVFARPMQSGGKPRFGRFEHSAGYFYSGPSLAQRVRQEARRTCGIDVLVINSIIYAEVSCHFSSIEELDEALSETKFVLEIFPGKPGFLPDVALLDIGGAPGCIVRRFQTFTLERMRLCAAWL
jgi:hypothetical protein